MKYRLLDFLECQDCKSEFKVRVFRTETVRPDLSSSLPSPVCREYCGLEDIKLVDRSKIFQKFDCPACYSEEIIDGLLYCSCGKAYPIHNAIPRLLPATLVDPGFYTKYSKELGLEISTRNWSADHTAHRITRTKSTFDVEWTLFKYEDEVYGHTKEDEESDFVKRTGFNVKGSENRLVLDVGCGIGRLIRSLAKYGVECVGVELSIGVDSAYSESSSGGRIHFIQGDIADLPMKSRIFDYVYCKGVLQYTPDAKEIFGRLHRLSKTGGVVSITMYPKLPPLFDFVNRQLRKLCLTLPPKIIYHLSFLLTPLFPIAWWLSGFPSRNIGKSERAHMIFNWFSSEFQSFHSRDEVVGWFEEEGFSDIVTFGCPMGVTGRLQ